MTWDPEQYLRFSDQRALLSQAYPTREGKTVFPFKRTFVVATNC